METAKDLWASVVAYVNERTTNPLTSAFVLSWALWNYKFFVLLFSDESPSSTFAAIDVLYPRPDIYFRGGFLYPAITALIYVFLYPYVTERVVKFYRKRQVSIANTLKAVEEQRVRTVAEVTRMVRAHEKALSAANEETTNARAATEDLRAALKKAEEEVLASQRMALTFVPTQRDETSDRLPKRAVNDPIDVAESGKLDDSTFEAREVLLSPTSRLGIRYSEPFSQRQLSVLTALTESYSMSPASVSEKLGIPQFWAVEELRRLNDIDVAQETSNGEYSINDAGRAVLRALIDEGKWKIEQVKQSGNR
jgi:F0F1-type ATP synthase membrane subunit b/b'